MKNLYVPKCITAGVTLKIIIPSGNFPVNDYVVTLHFRGPVILDTQAEIVNNEYVLMPDTGELSKGLYAYTIRAVGVDGTFEIDSGSASVAQDITTITVPGFDGRSDNQMALDAINSVLANRATRAQESYRINNRELKFTPIADLLKLRSHYSKLVSIENGTYRRGGRRIEVKFS